MADKTPTKAKPVPKDPVLVAAETLADLERAHARGSVPADQWDQAVQDVVDAVHAR